MIRKPLYIDIHALQTVPPSNINRDDTGSPKTARFGGVTRARVSSQAWKKAMRDEFADLLDTSEIGWRTMRAASLIAEQIERLAPEIDEEVRQKLAVSALSGTGVSVKDGNTSYLLFVSPKQVEALAKLAVEAHNADGKIDKKAAKAIFDPKKAPTLNAVDIALFGRMVADAPDLNVDASVQVAHAIGIGSMVPEFDYFTAMDDLKGADTAGAGMIGTVEFCSATFYRYATIDVYHLCENLGSARAAKNAIRAFVKAFMVSMPTGKQNTFANRTLPSAAIIQVRDSQPVSLANAFEAPVNAHDRKSQIEVACERLIEQEEMLENAFGVAPMATYVISAAPGTELLSKFGQDATLEEAVVGLESQVEEYLAACGFDSES